MTKESKEEPKIRFAIEAAGQKLRDAKKAAETLRRLLRHAQEELARAREDYAHTSGELRCSEAAAAAGEGADLVHDRKAFVTARDNQDFMATRVEGVKQLVAAAETSLELAEADFANEWLQYAGDQIRSYEAAYDRAVRSLLKVMDKGLALGLALGTPEALRVFYRLGRQQILSFGLDEKKYYRHRDSWNQDEEAVKEHHRVIDLRRELRGEKSAATTGT